MGTPPFEKFRKNTFDGRLITFDPGETTGFSIFDNGQMFKCGHLLTKEVRATIMALDGWLAHYTMDIDKKDVHVRMEEYRIYGWKTEQHAFSDVHTIRLIGALECLCVQKGIEYSFAGAGVAKTLITDVKLKDWGFWQPGMKHARDAIRHACYFYCKA